MKNGIHVMHDVDIDRTIFKEMHLVNNSSLISTLRYTRYNVRSNLKKRMQRRENLTKNIASKCLFFSSSFCPPFFPFFLLVSREFPFLSPFPVGTRFPGSTYFPALFNGFNHIDHIGRRINCCIDYMLFMKYKYLKDKARSTS